MKLTATHIEGDFYQLLKESSLGQEISGEVYRKKIRKYDSDKEDIVVSFISGELGQVQTGILSVNIYVPDLPLNDGRMVPDYDRIELLQCLLYDFVEDDSWLNYWLEFDSTPSITALEQVHQQIITARIKFKFSTL